MQEGGYGHLYTERNESAALSRRIWRPHRGSRSKPSRHARGQFSVTGGVVRVGPHASDRGILAQETEGQWGRSWGGWQSCSDSMCTVRRSLFTGWKMNLTTGPHIVSGTARREGDVWLVCGPHWQHQEPCIYCAWTWATQGELVRWAEAQGLGPTQICFLFFCFLFSKFT